jgi:ribosomal protein L11 methyltransferase
MNKTYKEFHIRTTPFIPEIISGLLWELSISGLTEESDFIKVFSSEHDLSQKEIETFLKRLIDEKVIDEFSSEEFELENRNWNEEWEKNLNIIKVTDRLVIRPSYKDYAPSKDEIVITIDPKMSFGTGEHQTTKLMLKLIEKYVQPGMKVLDVGSGTAVLSIASVKLGAEKVVAIDNDELCYENGIENCRINNVENSVEVRIGEIKDIEENDFDIILANIQKNILIDIASDLKSKLKKSSAVILSGLLIEDEEDIVKNYSELDFKLIQIEIMDEWIALAFKSDNH